MRHIALGYLTVVDAAPPDSISIAAACGYDGVSLSLGKDFLPPAMDLGVPLRSIIDDVNLRRDTIARARQTGVTLDQMEGFILWSGSDLDQWRAALDIAAAAGIPQAAAFDSEPDRARGADLLGALCEMAAERGMNVVMEFHARSAIKSIADTAALVTSGAYKNLRIMIDTLHHHRAGGTAADIANVPPSAIACAQFCDGALISESGKAYGYEGLFERKCPGDGAFPLAAMLKALPPDALIYLEVPQRAAREQGVSAQDRAQRALDGMRRVLAAA